MPEKLIVHSIHTIKILTINSWGIPFNRTKTARLNVLHDDIANLDADVVLVQEVWVKKDYDNLVSRCKYPYCTPYGELDYVGNVAGLVVLSKFPIINMRRINYRWKELVFNPVKAALRLEILIEGQKVVFFNTHLTANLEVSIGNEYNTFGKLMFTSDDEEVSRWDQLKTLTTHLKEAVDAGYPVILGGDLNTGPRYPLWYRWTNYLKDNFKDLFDSLSYTKGLPSTYINDFASRDQGQLDHILAFGKAKVMGSEVVFTEKKKMYFWTKCKEAYVSDHFGLQSMVAIPRSHKCNS